MPAAAGPPFPQGTITVQSTDEVLTVRVCGVLDAASNAPALEQCLGAVQAAEVLGPRRLVLDICALSGCDGAGLRAVLSALTRAEREGIALHIDGLDGVAGRILAGSYLRTDAATPTAPAAPAAPAVRGSRSGRAPRPARRAAALAGRHRPGPR
ncbi:STAS domain-containing protein [Planobispora siamensis]|uniref:STAS domain-containing protein n=1 Tax=Planobispora siamensis TaxID=936338 RepID=A0A8J3SQZ1_9ACTN|nr:STAS domain-containing protein [Planobispora siamensis]GIH97739.1 hypothetical protein Psi01_83690 [Planobispora siamensis]